MDPDELKIERRKSAITRWQQYEDQVKDEKKNPTHIKTGPMAGRSAKQLDLEGAVESNSSQDQKTTTKEDLKSQKCTNIAEKITAHLTNKVINSKK